MIASMVSILCHLAFGKVHALFIAARSLTYLEMA
jgi:hypothetical protein